MDTRNLLHLGLVLPTLGGLLMAGLLFSKSTEYPLTDVPFAESASSAWEKIFAALPAEMPASYADDLDTSETPNAVEEEATNGRFAETNAFIATCTIAMLLGFVGLGLVSGAKTVDEPVWHPLLRVGTIVSLSLFCVTYYGFNVAYPGDFNGFFSLGYLGGPESMDPQEYGMDGMTMWTDAFYFACYIAVLGVLVMTTTCARQTATSAFVIALPIILFIGPLVVSWKWGAGWLDSLGTYDFAGAGLFHWHAGLVVFGIGLILKGFRRTYPTDSDRPLEVQPAPIRLGLWIPGILLYSLLLLGMNTGSTLTAQPDLVAAVFQGTLYSGFTAAAVAAGIGLLFRTRSPIEWAGMGLIAGMVVVSGATDLLNRTDVVALGATAGLAMPLAVYACDRWLAIDPLGIFGMHGVPGAIGMLAVVTSTSDYGTGEGAIPNAGLLPQLGFLFTVPLISLATAGVGVVFFGLLRFLFFDRPIDRSDLGAGATPPPLPPSSL